MCASRNETCCAETRDVAMPPIDLSQNYRRRRLPSVSHCSSDFRETGEILSMLSVTGVPQRCGFRSRVERTYHRVVCVGNVCPVSHFGDSFRCATLLWHAGKQRKAKMSVDRTQTVEWDGKVLTGWVIVDGTPKQVSGGTVKRSTLTCLDLTMHLPGKSADTVKRFSESYCHFLGGKVSYRPTPRC
jgi:hypothetical protein